MTRFTSPWMMLFVLQAAAWYNPAYASYVNPRLDIWSVYEGLYNTEFGFGDPMQPISIRIDLLQGDIWVFNASVYPECLSSNTTNCATLGSYDALASKTYRNASVLTNAPFSTNVTLLSLNGLNATGNLVSDVIQWNNTETNRTISLTNFVFLDMFNLVAEGALGLGTTYSGTGVLNYFKLLNVTGSESFGLYCGSKYAQAGELHLGFVDETFFTGDLVVYDMLSVANNPSQTSLPVVALTGMQVESSTGQTSDLNVNNTFPIPVMFDTRQYFSFLPYDALILLAVQLNAVYNPDNHKWLVECSVGDINATVNLAFGDLTIKVPVAELLYSSNKIFASSGKPACTLAIQPDYLKGYSILGSQFLHAMYMVINHDSKQVALAQANTDYYYPTLSNVETGTNTEIVSSQTSFSAYTSTYTDWGVSYVRTETTSGNTTLLIPTDHIPYAKTNTHDFSNITLTVVSVTASDPGLYSGGNSMYISNGEIYTAVAGAVSTRMASTSSMSHSTNIANSYRPWEVETEGLAAKVFGLAIFVLGLFFF
ncbi:hypothetical protein BABINDRAFT_160528 [Babjeviella inositovora NRRL Y-12698]|uniref:Peptidase A1 domain-containing protein n=1 Tax=Babjeviella inositovora NRRL Y-12698 TaxID=984486 RepID=A0A1E3QTW0_9ASCO|nr:uncharacterized protein BABINDRAFT_160528 [Babjeviella inositovora NRRL Y-12698]ODQ81125.1 hypothetical protein BABINDRAFT_160528 [Babjeviella inositovora NRRL Y-12698]